MRYAVFEIPIPSLLTCLAVICWAMLGATFYCAWLMIIGEHWLFDVVFALIWGMPIYVLCEKSFEEPEPPEIEYYCDVCGTHYPADDPCPWH